MKYWIHYIPLLTTLVTIPFTVTLYSHWRKKPQVKYLLWWTLGVLFYGLGTLTESLTTIFGWHIIVFKAWYISGALLGGAPLAQGTVYLLFSDKTGRRTAAVLISLICMASFFVILSPVQYDRVEIHRLSGSVLSWQWVRYLSPFINSYAFVFLVGGAAWSAWKYWRMGKAYRSRFLGNTCIAAGALLPGIGGSAARINLVEVLYVTELIGLLLIWTGYKIIVNDRSASLHVKQQN